MEVVVSLSQGRTAAAQCGLFTNKSVPVIFEPPCTFCDVRTTTHFSLRIPVVKRSISVYIFFNFGMFPNIRNYTVLRSLCY